MIKLDLSLIIIITLIIIIIIIINFWGFIATEFGSIINHTDGVKRKTTTESMK